MIMFKKKTSDLLQFSSTDPWEMLCEDQAISIENCRLFQMMATIFQIYVLNTFFLPKNSKYFP